MGFLGFVFAVWGSGARVVGSWANMSRDLYLFSCIM